MLNKFLYNYNKEKEIFVNRIEKMNYFHSKKYVNRAVKSIQVYLFLNFWISHRYRPITPPSLVVHACFPRGRTKSKDVFFDLSRSGCWPARGFDLPNLIPHEHGKWTLDASLSTRITIGDRVSSRYERTRV